MIHISLMDFGIDGLIKMFEERFGKPAATALLALIGLAVAGWAFHTIWVDIVHPVADALSKASGRVSHAFASVTYRNILYYAYGCFAGAFGIAVLDRTWGLLWKRRSYIAEFVAAHSIRDLKAENQALKSELDSLKYPPAESLPAPAPQLPPTGT